jgi:transcription termination/antitermination protein NusG
MANKYEFVTGETVRLKSGAFQLFTGRVVSVNKEEETLKVVVSVLGKWRTVELRFSEVEKVA